MKVGSQSLQLAPVEVMSAVDANRGDDLSITIDAVKPDSGYVAGSYDGVVSILFETAAPAAR